MSKAEAVVYATLDDLARRRRIVTQLMRDIAMVYGVDVRPWLEDTTPASTETKPAAVETKKPKREPKAPARKPKERTRETRPQDASSGEGILTTLKQHGPLRPGDLFHRLGLDHADGRARVKGLVALGMVAVTGNTNNRRIALVH